MKIGLMGPFGYGNLGDAATQDAMIQNIRQRFPAAEICGYSLAPEDTEKRHGIKSYPISWQSWREDSYGPVNRQISKLASWLGRRGTPMARSLQRWVMRVPRELALILQTRRHLRGVELLIVSGGGQIEDYWGGGGPWSYPYTLLKWCLIARLSGAKVAVVSVGAGPIRHSLSKRFLRWALALAAYRSYRDEFSQRLVRSIGTLTDNGVFPDLAFSLDLPEVPSQMLPRQGRRIAVGPIGYMRPNFWPEEDAAVYERYAQHLTAFIRFLIDRGDTVVFVPGEAHYDQIVISEFRERLGDAVLATGRVERPKIDSVSDLLHVLAGVDFVVASRFHNLVMAHMLGKPTIALSYQEKIDCLMAAAGLSAFCFQAGDFTEAALRERMIALESEAAEVGKRLVALSRANRARLATQYDAVFSLLDVNRR